MADVTQMKLRVPATPKPIILPDTAPQYMKDYVQAVRTWTAEAEASFRQIEKVLREFEGGGGGTPGQRGPRGFPGEPGPPGRDGSAELVDYVERSNGTTNILLTSGVPRLAHFPEANSLGGSQTVTLPYNYTKVVIPARGKYTFDATLDIQGTGISQVVIYLQDLDTGSNYGYRIYNEDPAVTRVVANVQGTAVLGPGQQMVVGSVVTASGPVYEWGSIVPRFTVLGI